MKFLHTADWQIGKPFASIEDPAKRERVRQRRIEVIDRIAEVAREHGAEFVLVAGDLFDSPSPDRATVSAACAAIGRISVPVYVIPGNHDHGGPGGVWEQPFFLREREALAANLEVLTEAKIVEADSAVILPCPLLRRSESIDTTSWTRDLAVVEALPANRPRILLAHGSVQSFGGESEGDGAAGNRIELSRLPDDAFDYIALGDWHGTKQVAARAWYAGTPELDRFPKGADQQPGNVLIVTAERGRYPEVTPIRTARFEWRERAHDFAQDPEMTALRKELEELFPKQVGEGLLRLRLRGTLDIGRSVELASFLEGLAARLLHLRVRDETTIAPSTREFGALTEQQRNPLIAEVARQLVDRAKRDDADAIIARVALRELYAVCGTHAV